MVRDDWLTCRKQPIFISRQGLYVEVFHHYIAVSGVLSQILMYCDLLANGKWGHPFPPKTCWRLKLMVPKGFWWKNIFLAGEEVNCGAHKDKSRSACPRGKGAAHCNGDCCWIGGQCVLKSIGGLYCYILIHLKCFFYKHLLSKFTEIHSPIASNQGSKRRMDRRAFRGRFLPR